MTVVVGAAVVVVGFGVEDGGGGAGACRSSKCNSSVSDSCEDLFTSRSLRRLSAVP